MDNPYLDSVRTHQALLRDTSLPLFDNEAALPSRKRYIAQRAAPRVLIFSPHPDDECLMGVLPLRLMQESGFAVHNVAVTLGSNPARRAARWQELRLACTYLGFTLHCVGEAGLSAVTLPTRIANTPLWQAHIAAIAEYIAALQPDVVVLPHAHDAHPTHMGTHALVIDALKVTKHRCWVVQSEFWQPIVQPNVMVACSEHDLADLMVALACHVGEVSRNPYHRCLPAWMMDNVRRGAEIVGQQGQAAPQHAFAALYRIDVWDGVQLITNTNRHLIAIDQPVAAILQATPDR